MRFNVRCLPITKYSMRDIPKYDIMIASGTVLALLIIMSCISTAMAQEAVANPQDVMIIFIIFIIAVIALFLYLARHSILRRRTQYDTREYDSKKNRDYEKYHSRWLDDYDDYERPDDANPDDPAEDLYQILDIPPDADFDTIKTRYRTLVREHHPDISGQDSEDKMAKINRAYEILSDAEMRRRYDKSRR